MGKQNALGPQSEGLEKGVGGQLPRLPKAPEAAREGSEVALCLARPDGAEGHPRFVFKGLVHPPHQLLRLRIAAPVDEAFLQEVLLGMVFQHL